MGQNCTPPRDSEWLVGNPETEGLVRVPLNFHRCPSIAQEYTPDNGIWTTLEGRVAYENSPPALVGACNEH